MVFIYHYVFTDLMRKGFDDWLNEAIYRMPNPNAQDMEDFLERGLAVRIFRRCGSKAEQIFFDVRLMKGIISMNLWMTIRMCVMSKMTEQEMALFKKRQLNEKAAAQIMADLMAMDPGLKHINDHIAKLWTIATRTNGEKMIAMMSGFGEAGVETVKGVLNLPSFMWKVITTDEGAKIVKALGEHPERIFVMLDDYLMDGDRAAGGFLFEVALVVATMGLGDSATTADKIIRITNKVEELSKAGKWRAAQKLAAYAEKLAATEPSLAIRVEQAAQMAKASEKLSVVKGAIDAAVKAKTCGKASDAAAALEKARTAAAELKAMAEKNKALLPIAAEAAETVDNLAILVRFAGKLDDLSQASKGFVKLSKADIPPISAETGQHMLDLFTKGELGNNDFPSLTYLKSSGKITQAQFDEIMNYQKALETALKAELPGESFELDLIQIGMRTPDKGFGMEVAKHVDNTYFTAITCPVGTGVKYGPSELLALENTAATGDLVVITGTARESELVAQGIKATWHSSPGVKENRVTIVTRFKKSVCPVPPPAPPGRRGLDDYQDEAQYKPWLLHTTRRDVTTGAVIGLCMAFVGVLMIALAIHIWQVKRRPSEWVV